MSHEISINQAGQAEAVFALKPAWHGLGTLVDHRVSPKEALKLAHLDWTVEKQGLYLSDLTMIWPHVALVRSDFHKPIAVVGRKYIPVQNAEQANFLEALCGEGNCQVECAGALAGGRRIFWTVKLPESLVVSDKDVVDRYLILANGHDGKLGFRAFWSPIRVVCQNTLNAALHGERSGLTLRHTLNVMDRIQEARAVLGIADRYYQSLAEQFRRLATTKLGDDGFLAFLDELFPLEADEPTPQIQKVRSQVLQNWLSGAGADLAPKTLWNAYNAVTAYVSHQRPSPGQQRQAAERRFESILLGTGKAIQQKAFDAALALAGAN